MSTGVNYSGSRPDQACLKNAGITFVIRYLTPDLAENTWKRLTNAEAGRILDAGLKLVFVFEWGKSRMHDGRGAGQADAATAQAQLAGIARYTGDAGIAGQPVIFAADWDVATGEVPGVLAYLDGAHSQLGNCGWNPKQRRTSIYGGYRIVAAAFNAGKAGYGMQTFAWSTYYGGTVPRNASVVDRVAGKGLPGRFLFDTRAQIRQGTGGTTCRR